LVETTAFEIVFGVVGVVVTVAGGTVVVGNGASALAMSAAISRDASTLVVIVDVDEMTAGAAGVTVVTFCGAAGVTGTLTVDWLLTALAINAAMFKPGSTVDVTVELVGTLDVGGTTCVGVGANALAINEAMSRLASMVVVM